MKVTVTADSPHQQPKQASAVDNAEACGQSRNYEVAAAFDGVDEEVLGVEDALVELDSLAFVSVFTGAESLLSLFDSPALSLAELAPLRLSVR